MNTYASPITAAKWRHGYRTTIEVGLVLALLAVVGLLHAPLRASIDRTIAALPQEIVQLEDVQQTRQPDKPPPPPRVQTPVVVPDESLPDEVPLDLDASLDLQAELTVPSLPPPPPAVEAIVENVQDEIFVVVEEMPEIIGGLERLYELVVYPEVAARAGMEGMSLIEFVVTEEGLPTQPVARRSAGSILDDAAIAAIMQLRFKPGKQRQRAVKVRLVIPVRFRLDG